MIKADFVAITGPSFEFGYTHSFAPVRYRLPSSSLYLFNYLYLFPLRLRLASVAHRNPDGGEASKSADRKSTRLNSSHQIISYAVFCLKKKRKSNKSGGSSTIMQVSLLSRCRWR